MSRMVTYTVSVSIGNQWYAGTTNYVYLTLEGKHGFSSRTLLNKSFFGWFWLKTELSIDINVAESLGDVVRVTLEKEKGRFSLNDDWYCSYVKVTTPLGDDIYFPCYRWITNGTKVVLRDSKGRLPQDDEDKELRKEQLLEAQSLFRWMEWNPVFPMSIAANSSSELPLDVQFDYTKKKDFQNDINRGIKNLILNKIEGLFEDSWKSIDDLEEIFGTISNKEGLPHYVMQKWKEDSLFGYQFLNGCNPVMIRKCKALPQGFNVTHEMVKNSLKRGLTLKKEIEKGNIYIADYELLDGVKANDTDPKTEQFLAAPFCLLYKNKEGHIVPIAIQLTRDPQEKKTVKKNIVEKNAVEKNIVEKNIVEKNIVEKNIVEKNAVEKKAVKINTVENNAEEKIAVKTNAVEKNEEEKNTEEENAEEENEEEKNAEEENEEEENAEEENAEEENAEEENAEEENEEEKNAEEENTEEENEEEKNAEEENAEEENAEEENAEEENAVEKNAEEENAVEKNAEEENAVEKNAEEENAVEKNAVEKSAVEKNTVFLPEDNPYDWLLAKMWVKSCDFNLHQLVTHLLRTHLTSEVFAIAMFRQLAVVHPVYKLLIPHVRFTIAINTAAREKLISKSGVFDKIMSTGGKGVGEVIQNAMKTLTYRSLRFREAMNDQGVDKDLRNYYYRDDGTKVWKAIKSFVSEVVNIYYHGDKDVQDDKEIQAFVWDVCIFGMKKDPRTDDFPASLNTREDLAEYITVVIFTASAQHAAVNFGQFDWNSWIPNSPCTMRRPPPTQKGQVDMKYIMESLPDCGRSCLQLGTVWALSQFEDNEIYLQSKYRDHYFTEKRVMDAIETFRKDLFEVSNEIQSRNDNLLPEFSYRYLSPDKIPNSVAI